jgi:hypothetical protein
LTKWFAVVDVEYVRGLGFEVVQDNDGFLGHTLIRPATNMAATVYGTSMLQIPSFVRELQSPYGTDTIEIIQSISRDEAPIFSAIFHGITAEYSWTRVKELEGEETTEKGEIVDDGAPVQKAGADSRDSAQPN